MYFQKGRRFRTLEDAPCTYASGAYWPCDAARAACWRAGEVSGHHSFAHEPLTGTASFNPVSRFALCCESCVCLDAVRFTPVCTPALAHAHHHVRSVASFRCPRHGSSCAWGWAGRGVGYALGTSGGRVGPHAQPVAQLRTGEARHPGPGPQPTLGVSRHEDRIDFINLETINISSLARTEGLLKERTVDVVFIQEHITREGAAPAYAASFA